MYTLMKSEQSMFGKGVTGSQVFEQKKVTQYIAFEEALAACEKANKVFKDRYFVMNDSGKEYYADTWID